MYSSTVARAPASDPEHWIRSTAQQYFDIYLCSSIYRSSTACSTAADMQHHAYVTATTYMYMYSTAALQHCGWHCSTACAQLQVQQLLQHSNTAAQHAYGSSKAQRYSSSAAHVSYAYACTAVQSRVAPEHWPWTTACACTAVHVTSAAAA